MLQGIGMLIHSSQFQINDSINGQNATTWGWIELIVGLVVLVSGFGIFSGNVAARTVGVIAAVGSALASSAGMRLYPVWSFSIIAVDVAVIWALTAHGRDVART
jgi:hypothetical protein